MHSTPTIKVAVAFVASAMTAIVAQSETTSPPVNEITLTLTSIPHISIADPSLSTSVNPWGSPYHNKEVRRGLPSSQSHRALFDTPDGSMRLQLLRFNAVSTRKLLPMLNPELKK